MKTISTALLVLVFGFSALADNTNKVNFARNLAQLKSAPSYPTNLFVISTNLLAHASGIAQSNQAFGLQAIGYAALRQTNAAVLRLAKVSKNARLYWTYLTFTELGITNTARTNVFANINTNRAVPFEFFTHLANRNDVNLLTNVLTKIPAIMVYRGSSATPLLFAAEETNWPDKQGRAAFVQAVYLKLTAGTNDGTYIDVIKGHMRGLFNSLRVTNSLPDSTNVIESQMAALVLQNPSKPLNYWFPPMGAPLSALARGNFPAYLEYVRTNSAN